MTTAEPAGAVTGGDPSPVPEGRAPDLVLDYVLEPADALAWERRDPRYRRRNRAAYSAAGLSGMYLLNTASHLLLDLHILHSLPMAFVVLAAPAALVRVLLRHDLTKRARTRLAGAVQVRLEVTGDRLAEWRAGQAKPVALGARALRVVMATGGHVFLSTGGEVVIVPRRAFASDTEMARFAQDWENRLG